MAHDRGPMRTTTYPFDDVIVVVGFLSPFFILLVLLFVLLVLFLGLDLKADAVKE